MSAKRNEKLDHAGVKGFRRSGSALLGRLEAAASKLAELPASGQGTLFGSGCAEEASALLSPGPFRALAEEAYVEEGAGSDDALLVRAACVVLGSVPAAPSPGSPPGALVSFARAASDCVAMSSALLRRAGVMPYFACGSSSASDAESGVRVVLGFEGEGVCGRYDPSVFRDVRLLRFRVFVARRGSESEVEEASRLTMLPADLSADRRDRAARVVLDALLAEIAASGVRPSVGCLPEEIEAVCWRMSTLDPASLDALSAAGR